MLPGVAMSIIVGTASTGSGGGGGGSGGSGSLDTQTVTGGAAGLGAPDNDRQRGYSSGGASEGNGYNIGLISDGTSNLYSGAAIVMLGWAEGIGYEFVLSGTLANSGWTSMTIGGTTTLTRASATFTQSGGKTRWTWNSGNASSQAFGGDGNVVNVAFD